MSHLRNSNLFYSACENGDLDSVKSCISAGNYEINKDNYGYSPLFIACRQGHLDIVQFLLTIPECDVNFQSPFADNMAPLHIASCNGRVTIVQELLNSKECDVNCKNLAGDTPLHMASRMGHEGVVQKLLNSTECDVNHRNVNGDTALHIAIRKWGSRVSAITELLLSHPECDPHIANKKGITPAEKFFCTSVGFNVPVVKQLINKTYSLKCPLVRRKQVIEQVLALSGRAHRLLRCFNMDNAEIYICLLNDVIRYMWPAISKCLPHDISKELKHKLRAYSLTNDFAEGLLLIAFRRKNSPFIAIVLEGLLSVKLKSINRVQILHRAIVLAKQNGYESLFHFAYKYCCQKTVKYLFDDNVNPTMINSPDCNGATPLHLAVQTDNSKCVEILLANASCDPNVVNSEGDTPLHIACQQGSVEIIDLLLSTENFNLSQLNSKGNTVLHLAVQSKDRICVEKLLASTSCDPNIANSEGDTPLHIACQQGSVEIIDLLVGSDKLDLHVTNAHGKTPLHNLFEMKYFASIRTLLEKSCSPNYVNREHIFQEAIDLAQVCEIGSLLHLGCLYGSIGIVEFFLGSSYCTVAAVNKPDVNGDTPLHIATRENVVSIVEMLLDYQGVDPNANNAGGETALITACSRDYFKCAQILATFQGCDLNKQDNAGNTALHVAVQHDNSELVTILLRNNLCNPIISGLEDDTPLHLSVKIKNAKCVKALLASASCDPNIANSEGDTPLHIACQQGSVEIIDLLVGSDKLDLHVTNAHGKTPLHNLFEMKYFASIRTLLEKSCSPNYVNREQIFQEAIDLAQVCEIGSLLHLACLYGSIGIVEFFLDSSYCTVAAVNKPDVNGDTPLHIATRENVVSIVEMLLDCHGVDPNANNAGGETALITACSRDYFKCAQILATFQGCDLNKQDNAGNTALHVAVQHDNSELVTILLRNNLCNPIISGLEDDTPLHLSVKIKNAKCVKALLASASCDPNIANSEGDTPLHIACQQGSVEIIDLLVGSDKLDLHITNAHGKTPLHNLFEMKYFASIRTLLEKSCSPNYVNREQIFQEAIDLAQVCEIGSLLHLACLYGSIGIVEFFLDSSYCTVAAVNKPDVNGDTPLHIAAKSNLPAEGRIVQHLLACCYVDPNIKNARGVTPLQLAFEADYTTIVQLLLEQCTSPHYPYREQVIRDAGKLTTGNLLLDVCSWGNTTIAENLLNSDWYKSGSARVCYANGDTLLDVSIRNDHPAMVKLLIDSKTCNLEVRDGNTLLHNAVRTGSIGVMKALLCGKAIDPNNCNDLGETALHVACREGNLECIKLLINDKQCDVDRKSKTGDTALHIAIQDDPSDQINITKYLIENARCNLTIANAQGNTPLHLACNKGAWSVGSNMVTIVRLLLSTGKVDLESVNNGGNTPLELASGNSQIIMELNSFADTKLKRPLQSYIKLFFMGNACAGKSTLIQAICIEASKLRRFIPSSQYKQVSGVEPLTAGIVPLAFRSKYFGNAILYDFAGQHEYYSSHAAVLENLVLSSPPIFLLVFNLSMPFEDVIQELAYWWSFIDSHCKRASVTPHVILIASHKDIVKSMGQNVKDKMAHILKSLREIPAKFHIAGHVFIDCRKLVSKRLSELLTLLDKTCKKVRKSVYVDLRCHTLHAFLTDQFQYRVACKVFEVEAAIWTEDTVLPQDRTYLEKLLSILNDQDRILFLKSEKKIEESWILLQRQTLLCEVNGSIFAPENFKQHIKDFARSTGVVPLSRIKKRFRRYHPEVIVGALTHLEFCFKIEDYQTLHILASDSEPQGIDYENEQFYFFPALVRANNPTGVWKENSQMTFQCGWCYECTHPYQFLTSRFLHVLILRLAFSFALAVDQTSSEDCPVIRKKCSIWKHGIAWWNGYGIETIVEVGLQRHWVVVMMRCARGQEVKCVELRSAVIKSILDTKHHFSTSIVMSEYLISPSSVQYPFEKKDETALYSLKEVATTVVKGQSHVTHEIHDHHDPTQLTELLPFEPYFAMNELVMQKLFCDEYSQVQVTNDDLTLIAEGACQKTELFKSAIKPTASEWRECRQKAGNDEILLCLLLLQILHKRGSRTFQDFQEQLSKFSIFCGRNPLVST